MTDKKLKVGLIGCGRFAEPGHAVYYKVNPRCEFAAVCDSNIDAAKALARKYGVPRSFDNAEQMLEEAALDAVSVCTPTFTHASLVEAAASRGVHVLCEKPFSASVEDARRMISACENNNVRLHVGFHMRYDRGLIRTKDLMDSKTYGDCFHAEFRWRGLTTMGNVPIVNKGLSLAKLLGFSTEKFSPDWRLKDPRIPGGVLEVFCHLIDLALWMFGEPDKVEGHARAVSPDAEKPELAVALFKYDSGPSVYLTMSSRTLSLWESHEGRFSLTGGNLSYDTNSQKQAGMPARVTVETDSGLMGTRRSLPPSLDPRPAHNLPHYHKIDNFILDALGELPDEEDRLVARGKDGLAVDAIIREIMEG
jgi:predicted dehydrogenase